MNVLVINTNRSLFPVPVIPYGACIAAESAAKAGHRVYLLDLTFQAEPKRALSAAIQHTRPDVIGLSVRNIDNNDLLSPVFYIAAIRTHIELIRDMTNVPIILGGAALMVMPEQILRYTGATLAVLGDGEIIFPELLGRLLNRKQYGDLAGIASIENDTFKINPAAPGCHSLSAVPDFHQWIDVKKYRSHLSTVPLQSKLGCGFHCIYCTYRKIEGAAYRLLDPELIAGLAGTLIARGLREIELVDNVFNAPYEHAVSVCETLIRKKIYARFQSVELNPFHFTDELLTVMERAGFVAFGMTAESASDEVLQRLKKGFSGDTVYAAAKVVRRHRLPCIWIFLLGGPGETERTVRETIQFAEKAVRPQDIAFFNIGIRIYPGTELESLARREGLLSVAPEEMLEPVFYLSPKITLSRLVSLVRDGMNRNMNFMNGESLNFAYLPRIHRLGFHLGLRSPLWRYTRHIRRGLRLLGMEV